MSDIHGHRRRFDSIMAQINLQPEDTLYVLGDVIDRNPNGIQILRQLMSMPNARMLLGNHEYMMLEALYHTCDGAGYHAEYYQERKLMLWYQNGGEITHRYLKRIRKAIRQEILSFLDNCPVNTEIEVNGKTYILTHAAPVSEYYNSDMKYRNDREFAVWYRYHSYDEGPEDCIVVFGHTPTIRFQKDNPTRIWCGKNLINLDCGAAYEGIGLQCIGIQTRLACLRLDDGKEFYSEEGNDESETI